MDDNAIIESFLTEKETLIERLFQKYKEKIYGIAYLILFSKEFAIEVCERTFISVYREIENFDSDKNFYAWLCKVAVGICLQIQAREKMRTETFMSIKKQLKNLEIEKYDPYETARNEKFNDILDQAIYRLPTQQRISIILHDIEGLSKEEIANIIDANAPTIRTHLGLGREKIKEFITPLIISET